MFAQVPCRQWTEEVVLVLEKVREQGVSIDYYPIVFAMLLPFASVLQNAILISIDT